MTTSLERDSTSLERDTLYKQAFSEANDHWPLRPWVALGGCGGGGGGTGGTGGGGGGAPWRWPPTRGRAWQDEREGTIFLSSAGTLGNELSV